MTHRLQMRLTDQDLERLDTLRGKIPRSVFLRGLINYHYEIKEEEGEIVDTTTDHQDERRSPSRRTPRAPRPNHLVAVAPGDRHLHRYTKGELVKWVGGIAHYQYTCDCGTQKVDR